MPEPGRRHLAELAALALSLTPKLVGYFFRTTEGEATARELTQETLVRAVVHLDSFRSESRLSTWVWSIAANVLKEYYRSRRASMAVQVNQEIDPDTLTSATPAHLNVQGDCVRRGFSAFAAEHPDRAQAIYLAYVEGWTREELAEHLGRTAHATTEYLSQCRQRLRPFIAECTDDT